MRAKMMVITNSEEIAIAQQAASKDESVVIPEKETEYTDFLFNPNDVSWAYIAKDGGIRILYNGQDLSLEYDKEIFDGLEENFNNRN